MKISSARVTKAILVNVSIALVFFSIVTPGIIWDKNKGFQAVDQNKYHLPQVETFVKTPLTWGTYSSSTATTPGHHLVLSWVAERFAHGQVVDRTTFPVRIANALFGLGLLLALWWLTYLNGTKDIIESTYLVLPLLFSCQFLGSAIWVMTDNGALFWACLTLLTLTLPTSLKRESFQLPLAGIFAAVTIAWRQTYIWLLIPTFLRVFKAAHSRQRWYLYLAVLPPLLVLGYFLSLWHGLTPPEFQDHYAPGYNLAVPAYVISLFGVFGLFYIGYLSTELQKIKAREMRSLIATSLTAGLGIALLFPSSYERQAGRWGGWLWEIARRLPSIYDRSTLFMVLVPLGTVLISLWFRASRDNKDSTLILISMFAWTAVHVANFQVYQRYYEALLLVTLAFLASRHTDHFRKNYLGPLVLAGLMAAISLQQIVFN